MTSNDKYPYSYGPVSAPEISDKFDDLFEEIYDGDGDGIWATKRTYRQIDPGCSFKYKYVFQAIYPDDEDDKDIATSLSLVMMPELFCKAKRAKLAEVSGMDEDKLEVYDVFSNGWEGVVQLAAKTVHGEKELKLAKDTAASCLSAFDGMRGFFIDRSLNMVGTTGWDMIFEAKGRIKDALKASLRRLKRASA